MLTVTHFLHSYLYRLSGRRDVEQGNVNILQHLQSDRRSCGITNLYLNLPIQFYLNNMTNLQLTSHSMTSCPTT